MMSVNGQHYLERHRNIDDHNEILNLYKQISSSHSVPVDEQLFCINQVPLRQKIVQLELIESQKRLKCEGNVFWDSTESRSLARVKFYSLRHKAKIRVRTMKEQNLKIWSGIKDSHEIDSINHKTIKP